MALFVHLTPASRAKRLARDGIRRPRGPLGGVFAVPVTPNFYLTHQWLRELRRWTAGPLVGVYFRLPDDQPVRVGPYRGPHATMTAVAAVGRFWRAGRDGDEVIIPRRVAAREILRVERLPQLVGWRYHPGAHGTRPCGCDYCQRGLYGARKLRAAYRTG